MTRRGLPGGTAARDAAFVPPSGTGTGTDTSTAGTARARVGYGAQAESYVTAICWPSSGTVASSVNWMELETGS